MTTEKEWESKPEVVAMMAVDKVANEKINKLEATIADLLAALPNPAVLRSVASSYKQLTGELSEPWDDVVELLIAYADRIEAAKAKAEGKS